MTLLGELCLLPVLSSHKPQLKPKCVLLIIMARSNKWQEGASRASVWGNWPATVRVTVEGSGLYSQGVSSLYFRWEPITSIEFYMRPYSERESSFLQDLSAGSTCLQIGETSQWPVKIVHTPLTIALGKRMSLSHFGEARDIIPHFGFYIWFSIL